MYTISNEARRNIERVVGLDFDEIKKMTPEEERQWVEKRTGKKLVFSKKRRYGRVGRGNPLISRRKIRTLEDLEQKETILTKKMSMR